MNRKRKHEENFTSVSNSSLVDVEIATGISSLGQKGIGEGDQQEEEKHVNVAQNNSDYIQHSEDPIFSEDDARDLPYIFQVHNSIQIHTQEEEEEEEEEKERKDNVNKRMKVSVISDFEDDKIEERSNPNDKAKRQNKEKKYKEEGGGDYEDDIAILYGDVNKMEKKARELLFNQPVSVQVPVSVVVEKKGESQKKKDIFRNTESNHHCSSTKQLATMFMEYLLYPMSLEQFDQDYLQKRPLVIKRLSSTYFDVLGCRSEKFFDTVFEQIPMKVNENINITSYYGNPNHYGLERKTHGETGKMISKAELVNYYENLKCSLRLLHPHRYDLKMHLCNYYMEEYFRAIAGNNIYITPPNSQGFAPHYDDVDAYILQVEGRKRWRVYAGEEEMELAREPSRDFTQEDLFKLNNDDYSNTTSNDNESFEYESSSSEEIRSSSSKALLSLQDEKAKKSRVPDSLLLDVVLEEGDLLYMPRGIIHQAECCDSENSTESNSIHITLSTAHQQSWYDVIEKIFPAILEEAWMSDFEIRKTIPRKFLNFNSEERGRYLQTAKAIFNRMIDNVTRDQTNDDEENRIQPPKINNMLYTAIEDTELYFLQNRVPSTKEFQLYNNVKNDNRKSNQRITLQGNEICDLSLEITEKTKFRLRSESSIQIREALEEDYSPSMKPFLYSWLFRNSKEEKPFLYRIYYHNNNNENFNLSPIGEKLKEKLNEEGNGPDEHSGCNFILTSESNVINILTPLLKDIRSCDSNNGIYSSCKHKGGEMLRSLEELMKDFEIDKREALPFIKKLIRLGVFQVISQNK